MFSSVTSFDKMYNPKMGVSRRMELMNLFPHLFPEKADSHLNNVHNSAYHIIRLAKWGAFDATFCTIDPQFSSNIDMAKMLRLIHIRCLLESSNSDSTDFANDPVTNLREEINAITAHLPHTDMYLIIHQMADSIIANLGCDFVRPFPSLELSSYEASNLFVRNNGQIPITILRLMGASEMYSFINKSGVVNSIHELTRAPINPNEPKSYHQSRRGHINNNLLSYIRLMRIYYRKSSAHLENMLSIKSNLVAGDNVSNVLYKCIELSSDRISVFCETIDKCV